MELRDCIIAVLHRHGVIRMTKVVVCLVEMVEIYLTDFQDMLMSTLLRNVAAKYGIEKTALTSRLRDVARRIERRDPEWYAAAFPEQYTTAAFIRAVAWEALSLNPVFDAGIGWGKRRSLFAASGGIAMQATGTLSVRVYTSQAQIPLEGATVVVASPGEEGKWKLLSIQNTDSSGKIRPVQIDAPAVGESTSPGGLPGDGAPFTLCSVWAEQPGYAMLQVENVQIFPGVETMQSMELIPLPQGLCSLQQRDQRDIPAQSL